MSEPLHGKHSRFFFCVFRFFKEKIVNDISFDFNLCFSWPFWLKKLYLLTRNFAKHIFGTVFSEQFSFSTNCLMISCLYQFQIFPNQFSCWEILLWISQAATGLSSQLHILKMLQTGSFETCHVQAVSLRWHTCRHFKSLLLRWFMMKKLQ